MIGKLLLSGVLTSFVLGGVMTPAPAPIAPGDTARRWWEPGHATVCDIAWREMSDGSKDAVRGLLALDPDFTQFGPSCYWPDLIRGVEEYAVFGTAHYVNLPHGAEAFDLTRDCAANICVVEAIELFRGQLRDPKLPAEQKLVALKFLGHFVGDIHQPLHAGYSDDLGGNRVHACTPSSDSTNLHAVWDGFIVEHLMTEGGTDWMGLGARLQSEIKPTHRAQWYELDARVWANESYALVEDEVYQEAGAGCFTAQFANRHAETTERRLKQGGYRLAMLLDDIFGAL